MKKLLIIFLSVFSLTAVAQQKPKIAVYMTGEDPINEIVSNRLVDDFARGNEYTTVERTASFLAELSKEHAYERSGEVDDEQIAALGRQFNVQYVCVVSVLDVWDTEKYITARIIDAETAEVIASCSSNGSIQNSSELIGALNTLSDSFFKAMRSSKQENAKKVAVYVSKTGNRNVDIVLGDQLVSGFARSGRYVAIERTNSFLKKLKDEQGYQQSGAVADDDLTRWGQQFGVQYVCIAKSTSWAGDYFITTRMVDVKTGEVANSYKVEGRKLTNSRDVVRVAQEIAAELSKGTLAEQAEEKKRQKEIYEKELRPIQEQLNNRYLKIGNMYVAYPLGFGKSFNTDNLCVWKCHDGGFDVINCKGSAQEIQIACKIGGISDWHIPTSKEISEINKIFDYRYISKLINKYADNPYFSEILLQQLMEFMSFGDGYHFWTNEGKEVRKDGMEEKNVSSNTSLILMLVHYE